MTFRIAIVQPISHRPGEDERNVAEAVSAIEHAAHEGADFVCFPETYPGPWRMPATFDPTAAMAEAAASLVMALIVVVVNRSVWKRIQSLANERCRFIT